VVRALVVALGMTVVAIGAARAEGDAAKGEQVFKRCMPCHNAENKTNKIGPYLQGVVGRKAGTAEGFNYSDAMKNSGLTWDEANLNQYLENPKAKVPGNKMAFPGLPKQEDRDNVIAYLKKNSG
jgi:cytochrome c